MKKTCPINLIVQEKKLMTWQKGLSPLSTPRSPKRPRKQFRFAFDRMYGALPPRPPLLAAAKARGRDVAPAVRKTCQHVLTEDLPTGEDLPTHGRFMRLTTCWVYDLPASLAASVNSAACSGVNRKTI